MPRFAVTRGESSVDIVFDDGGMNLLSSEALRELDGVIAAIPTEAGAVRVVTFRSGRPALFAAGADMAEMRAFGPLEAGAFARLGQETFARIERLPMITVAVIDGDCFGGALDLAFAFDLRFATARSRFSHPGARLGIVTGFGGTSRWRRLLTPGAARTLFLANPILAVGDALATGLIDAVGVPDATGLAERDPASVRALKELVRHGPRLAPRELVRLAELLGELYGVGENGIDQGDPAHAEKRVR